MNTSQADSYLELLVPQRKAILEKSAILGHQLQSDYPGVESEQLAVEVAVRGSSTASLGGIAKALYVR